MDIHIGDKFYSWTVIDDKPRKLKRKNPNLIGYLCECSCHNKTQKIIEKNALLSGHSKSCGCTRHKKHGMAHSKIYRQWAVMKRRCYDTKLKGYNDYGGRGISVCDEWLNNFESFYQWAIANGYDETKSIDRINVNGNYCPDNCKWSTSKEQANNKRNNIILEYNGKSLTLKQWSEQDEVRIKYGTLLRRYHLGWDVEDILFKEVNNNEINTQI